MELKTTLLIAVSGLALLFLYSCKEKSTSPGMEQDDPRTLATLTTAEVENITSVTATSGGNITNNGNADVSARGVCWSTSQNPTTGDDCTSDGTGSGMFTSAITGLEGNTEYFIRAFATNSEGTAYGNELSFTTLPETVEDADGNVYGVQQIGDQLWMAENLRVTTYRDGTPLPTLTNPNWFATSEGAYAIYPNGGVDGIDSDEELVEAYGALYNWHAVHDERGLCPVNWHIPTDQDWTDLAEFIGGSDIGNKLKDCRQEDSPLGGNCNTNEHPRWSSHDTHHGTDEFGFSVLPAGRRDAGGTYVFLGTEAWLWSSSESSDEDAFSRRLINQSGDFIKNSDSDKRLGLSVRCIMD